MSLRATLMIRLMSSFKLLYRVEKKANIHTERHHYFPRDPKKVHCQRFSSLMGFFWGGEIIFPKWSEIFPFWLCLLVNIAVSAEDEGGRGRRPWKNKITSWCLDPPLCFCIWKWGEGCKDILFHWSRPDEMSSGVVFLEDIRKNCCRRNTFFLCRTNGLFSGIQNLPKSMPRASDIFAWVCDWTLEYVLIL